MLYFISMARPLLPRKTTSCNNLIKRVLHISWMLWGVQVNGSKGPHENLLKTWTQPGLCGP